MNEIKLWNVPVSQTFNNTCVCVRIPLTLLFNSLLLPRFYPFYSVTTILFSHLYGCWPVVIIPFSTYKRVLKWIHAEATGKNEISIVRLYDLFFFSFLFSIPHTFFELWRSNVAIMIYRLKIISNKYLQVRFESIWLVLVEDK